MPKPPAKWTSTGCQPSFRRTSYPQLLHHSPGHDRYVSDEELREALDKAPPAIIDARAWAYRNSVMGRDLPRPMPRRSFG